LRRSRSCGPFPPPTRVRNKIASLALACAWLCANGALLDAVQVFAWAKMFTGYTQTMSVATALQKTFDPAQRCEMCDGVAAAKESSREHHPRAVEQSAEKLLLALHRPAPLVFDRAPGDWPSSLALVAPSRTEAVPVPPPRV
jgi:hypothetical protein